jgi:hypothetical protein
MNSPTDTMCTLQGYLTQLHQANHHIYSSMGQFRTSEKCFASIIITLVKKALWAACQAARKALVSSCIEVPRSHGSPICGTANYRALSTLEGRRGQSASRILGVDPVVVLFNALGTSGFAWGSRATVQHLFVFFVAFRECRRDVPTHTSVKAIARSSRHARPCVALWPL